MHTTIFTTFENSQLAKAWDKLFPEIDTSSPFLNYGYLSAWWHNLGQGELKIIAVWEESTLLGVAPFSLIGNTLQLLGGPEESDYLDWLIHKNHSQTARKQLWHTISELPWTQLKLFSLPEKSPTRSFFAQQSNSIGKQTESLQNSCPVIDLTSGFADYQNSLNSKTLKYYLQTTKNVGIDDELGYQCLTKPAEVKVAVADFIRLHQLSSPDKAAFWNEGRKAFFQAGLTALAEQGIVQLYFLTLDGVRAASLIVFVWQNQFLLYNSGFDAPRFGHLRVGSVLIWKTLQEAFAKGKTRYDFMRGTEQYKLDLNAKTEPVFDFTIDR